MSLWQKAPLPVLAIALPLLLAGPVVAADFASLVIEVLGADAGNLPAPLRAPVVVCVGDEDNPVLYTRVTGSGSEPLRLDWLPTDLPLVVTLNARFHNSAIIDMQLAPDEVRQARATLRPGEARRECRNPELPPMAPDDRPRIESFLLNNGAATTSNRFVRLNHAAPGEPDAWRAGETRDLADAEWQNREQAPLFGLALEGPAERTVWFQVRRGDLVSGIASASIVWSPPTGTRVLPFLPAWNHAIDAGWEFHATALNPASHCRLRVAADGIVMTARSNDARADGTCEFVLFGGARQLAGGWSLEAHERSRTDDPACRYTFHELPDDGTGHLTWRIGIAASPRAVSGDAPGNNSGAASDCAYRIHSIVLRGPVRGHWQDAFADSPDQATVRPE